MRQPLPSDHPLRAWRLEHRVSLENLAERTASTAATISRIEAGKLRPSWELAKRLGAVAGIEPQAFLDRQS